MKERTKDILYGIWKFVILILGLEFFIQLFAVVTLFMIKTLEMSLTPLQFIFNVIYAIAFMVLIISSLPDDFFKRKKKEVIKDGNKR